MQYWPAFLIGFLGSFHCVAMCGPLALAAPGVTTPGVTTPGVTTPGVTTPGVTTPGDTGKLGWLKSRLLYQAGRILTYALLGAVAGLLSQAFLMAGWQRGLSIAGGLLLLILALAPTKAERMIGMAGPLGKPVVRVKNAMAQLLRQRKMLSGFLLGLLNGLLPCGLVYLGLAGALVTGSALNGALYMAAFGAGTLPALLLVVFAGSCIKNAALFRLQKLAPAAAFIMGLALIVRGLSMGVPYLSPVLAWVEKGIPICGQ